MIFKASIENHSKDFVKDRLFNVTLLRDVHKIISGPGKTKSFSFMSAALSDIVLLLQKAYKVIRQEMRDKSMEGRIEKNMEKQRDTVIQKFAANDEADHAAVDFFAICIKSVGKKSPYSACRSFSKQRK